MIFRDVEIISAIKNIQRSVAWGAFAACLFCVGQVDAKSDLSYEDPTVEVEFNYRVATQLDAADCQGSRIFVDRVGGIIWNWETSDPFQFTLNQPTWESSPVELMPV